MATTGAKITALNAVTATTTSDTILVGDKRGLSWQFTAANITLGNGSFAVEVSNDGTNWVTYNRLTSNLSNTNTQTDTRVASVALSTNTSAVYFIPAGDAFLYTRCVVTRTTDGTYSAVLGYQDVQ